MENEYTGEFTTAYKTNFDESTFHNLLPFLQ